MAKSEGKNGKVLLLTMCLQVYFSSLPGQKPQWGETADLVPLDRTFWWLLHVPTDVGSAEEAGEQRLHLEMTVGPLCPLLSMTEWFRLC